jgi:hypothetical protein
MAEKPAGSWLQRSNFAEKSMESFSTASEFSTGYALEQPGHVTAEFVFDTNLGIGEYVITLALHKGVSHLAGMLLLAGAMN